MKPSVLFVSVLLIIPGIAAAIPNPAVVYCIEQGYEYDDGMCIFPDGSQCNVWQYYCKCEPNGTGCGPGDFNCAFPCQEISCRQAGQLVTIGECCPQLAEIPRIEAYDEKCNLLGWLGWLFICADCGDGICESWESACNCPQDCAPVHNITQETYHQTIQAAIDDANDGDKIIVADGTYTSKYERGFDFRGKAIIVRSENGPESCVIDGQDFARGFYFHNGEDANSVLDGFTITNGGWPYEYGGGIYCRASSPTIRNCIISNNTAPRAGGILCLDSSPAIANCIITANHATAMSGSGGGIFCWRSSPIIANSTISGNSANTVGGAIFSYEYSSPTITNCTITGNSASAGGAIHCYESNAAMSNCILWDNLAEAGSQIGLTSTHSDRPCTLSLNYSDLQGGQSDVFIGNWSTLNWGPGNIDGDPCFVEWGYWDHNGTPDYIWDDFWMHGDYHLLADSPCIDAGDPNYIPESNETDLDGNPRIIGGRIDMGAYEFELLPVIEAVVKISPNTLNAQSKGRWVSCYILLPQDCNAADIDPNSILLEDEIPPDKVVPYGRLAMAKFSRPAVQQLLSDLQMPAEVELLVSGRLKDGTPFEGADTITLINTPGRRNRNPTRPPAPPKPKKHRKRK